MRPVVSANRTDIERKVTIQSATRNLPKMNVVAFILVTAMQSRAISLTVVDPGDHEL